MKSPYPTWFFIPAGVFYVVLFLVPTFASFYFSLTRWTLFDVEFIGFDNFVRFFQEPQLVTAFINTFIYAFVTSGAKVVLGLLLGVFLSSQIIGRGFLRAIDLLPGARQHDRRRHPVQGAHGPVRGPSTRRSPSSASTGRRG
jgi:raffinose/stachyose/melibiose transport system permease protein